MRLLFSRSASPHHGFAAYYTFLEKIFGADAVLHFGTHGSLEFMPGKQVRPGAWNALICFFKSDVFHVLTIGICVESFGAALSHQGGRLA